jgi:hypothetical protein
MVTIDTKDLLGRSFLKDSAADGQRFRARIMRAILENDADLRRPQHVKFLCEVDGDTANDIYTYNQVLDLIERNNLDMDSDPAYQWSPRPTSHVRCPLQGLNI